MERIKNERGQRQSVGAHGEGRPEGVASAEGIGGQDLTSTYPYVAVFLAKD